VCAERDDPIARQMKKPVEMLKGPDNKLCNPGKLLHPEAYGYPESMGKHYNDKKEVEGQSREPMTP